MHTDAARRWVEQNMTRISTDYAGRWVAIRWRGGIIGTSDSFDGVFAEAEKAGVANPLVFKVPAANAKPKAHSPRIRHAHAARGY